MWVSIGDESAGRRRHTSDVRRRQGTDAERSRRQRGGQQTPLNEPPRLRTDDNRAASRLELFYDLAYVLVIHQLAIAFTKDLTWHGAAVFAGLFTITWWSWVTMTLYANRFDTNDVIYRVLKLSATFAVAVMAASAGSVPSSGVVAFTIGYVATRIVLAVLYARAWVHIVDSRPTINLYFATTISAHCCGRRRCSPPVHHVRTVGNRNTHRGVGAVAATRWGPDIPLHLDHLPERFGLFVILVLGESVSAIVLGMHDTHWALSSIVVAALGFTIAAAMWWMYFDIGGAEAKTLLQSDDDAHSSGRADSYIYGHLPLTLGAALLGVGIEQYVLHPVGELTSGGRWALCGGLALFVTGVCMVLAGSARTWRAVFPWPAVAIPAVVAVGFIDNALPFASAIFLAIGSTVAVVTGIIRRRQSAMRTTET